MKNAFPRFKVELDLSIQSQTLPTEPPRPKCMDVHIYTFSYISTLYIMISWMYLSVSGVWSNPEAQEKW